MGLIAAASASALCASGSQAAEIYGQDGIEIRWDNTLRYSAGFRLSSLDPALTDSANSDDGDRDFAPGPISNRLDIRSRFNLSHGDFGLHLSAAAWYDSIYHEHTANTSQATYNPIGVPSSDFAPKVRDLHGLYAELDDAFVYGSATLGGIPLSFRVGRQTLIWGESLFYDDYSIAAAQAPIDYTRTFTQLDTYGSDLFLPVGQASLVAQPANGLSLSFYYQFEWRASRQPGDGSYFSFTDYIGSGANRLFLAPDQYLTRMPDETPSGGQYGAALRVATHLADLGFYLIRYNSMAPALGEHIADGDSAPTGAVGSYWLAYPAGIDLYGASFNSPIGSTILAGEISFRHRVPLEIYSDDAFQFREGRQYQYDTRGDNLDVRASVTSRFGSAWAWDSADLGVELVGDDITGVESARAIGPWTNRFVMHVRARLTPRYFQVRPNLDLTVPISIGHDLVGHDIYDAQYGGNNDIEIGVTGIYRAAWKAGIAVTEFLGSPGYQPLADRSFVSLSIERTF